MDLAEKQVLTVKEVAALTDRSEATIYRWIRKKKLRTWQPGKRDDVKPGAGGAVHLIRRDDVRVLVPSAYEAKPEPPKDGDK